MGRHPTHPYIQEVVCVAHKVAVVHDDSATDMYKYLKTAFHVTLTCYRDDLLFEDYIA